MENKTRLIDANAMREDWLQNGQNEYVYDTNAVLDSIDAQLTVDAVEVVRCKSCKKWRKNRIAGIESGVCLCGKPRRTKPDDFCSYGERRGGK